ncbi:MAG TPA: CpsD/CapB family tyrosine-protein kinase [Blastocatellia bacterium]|nr:CpsD/CapB family tyrosine-protein kinase [Blastocatellia bacterium]
MGRVLDALQRQQEEDKIISDPLAASIGAPSTALDQDGLKDSVASSRIGVPVAPMSNDGAPLSFLLDEDRGEIISSEALDNSQERTGHSVRPRNPFSKTRKMDEALSLGEGSSAKLKPQQRGNLTPETIEPHVTNLQQIEMSRLHRRLILFTDQNAPGCEQYRTLRTQIFHAAERQPTQIIVLTSATAGEGKTSTVLNLAWAIAQSKENRVLVIDCDLRRPSVSSYLGLKSEKGLSEVITQEQDVFSCVVRVANESLYVLSANHEEPQPTELLSRERLGELLNELRQYFDYILIDAPPVVPFADARLLANHADAIIMVVRAGLAGHSTIERAIEALPSSRILGVVLNGADQVSEVGYYGYYGYGYNYSKQKANGAGLGWGSLLRLFKGRKNT